MGAGIQKTHDEFCNEVYKLVKNEYTVIGQYHKARENLLMKHNICNYIYPVSPDRFLRGQRCPKCEKRIKRDINKLKQEIYSLVKDEYTVLSDQYKDANTHILIRHNVCGHEYPVTPHKFLLGTRCPKCFGGVKGNIKDFKEKVYKLVENEYEVLGEYINARTHIQIKHNICQHDYPVTPDNFLRGRRCPYCSESYGEIKIRLLLEQYNIPFEKEYIFEDLLSDLSNPLRFDFCIFENNNKQKIKLLIEYDGVFHYKKQFEEHNFELQQTYDKRKNKYCKEHNIKLLRIPYWKFDNVEKILIKVLNLEGEM